MVILDVPILVYAHSPTSPHRAVASRWIEDAMTRGEPLGMPWSTVHAFLRLATNPRAFEHPLTIQAATDLIDSYLSRSQVSVPNHTPGYWRILQRLLVDCQASHHLVMDAHLAALAYEHNATICTNDRDFSRFPGLKVIYPLQEAKN